MAIVVQKYGGSSVADVEKIKRVADKVVKTCRAGNQVAVVVSAMGKTTDALLALAKDAASGAVAASSPPRRELDMLVTTGERVTMALLSIAIHARGLDAISFTGSQCGIITNDRHFNARIIEVRPHRVEDELARGRVVIVAGYQGMSYKREITTLGRGGSDTTAVALAAALGADRCEIYSDVDGVYSADPRVVPDAVHIGEIGSDMLQEMAECGAKVLNAQAIEWAHRAGIAIYARASFGTTDKSGAPERQTIVRRLPPDHDKRVRAIVGDPSVVLVRFEMASQSDGFVSDGLRKADIALRDWVLSDRCGSFVVPLAFVPDWASAKHALQTDSSLTQIRCDEDVSTVSVVGNGLAETTEPLCQFMQTLRQVEAGPRQTHVTPLRLTAVIARSHYEKAQQALHETFVRGKGESVQQSA